jgi:hypothetical protein
VRRFIVISAIGVVLNFAGEKMVLYIGKESVN